MNNKYAYEWQSADIRSKGKDHMTITYSAMSKSRAIMALSLHLEKRLSEAEAVLFLIPQFRKEEKTGPK